ncbi:protein quick-to-court isoform X2 [Daktulosphaira vitifoliae]|uniref:protein quick-to-court isoform X2 n=1 Tax=Daktulosphaira vitifoliae TaxID=58002 RepID=UPI0021AA9C89|nr:protein quick-to-court isoform X2 [Daktulosphaira vitifoliae]
MSSFNNASPSKIPKPKWQRNTSKIQRHHSLQTLNTYEKDDDLASEKSFGSTTSSQCDSSHSIFALNGTTYSNRKKAYLHYCPSNVGSEEYLTPTQRSSRTIRNLRRLLNDAHSELNDKDTIIEHLKKENNELKIKCGYQTADDSIAEGDEEEENIKFTSNKDTPSDCDSVKLTRHFLNPSPSPADSGHSDEYDEIKKLRQAYDELREKHNDKIEELLKNLGEINEKYYTLKPMLDEANIRIKELERENEFLKWSTQHKNNDPTAICNKICVDSLTQTDSFTLSDKQTNTDNLIEIGISEIPTQTLPIVSSEKFTETNLDNDSIEELSSMKIELQKTKAMYENMLQQQLEQQRQRPVNDAEMTLQFLKSAIYYYLTDPSNCTGHLNAIISILRYSDIEKSVIEKNQAWK